MTEMNDREFITPFGPEKGPQIRPEQGAEQEEAQTGVQPADAGIVKEGIAAEMPAEMSGSEAEQTASGHGAESSAASPEIRKNKALNELDEYLRGSGGAGSVNVHDLEGTPPDEILNVIMSDKQ
ncbi:hypothetical protein KGQ24_01060 [Patescibacteria group bacterium]|nr:hypothetical protein [Patescibacteria group bacterium]